MAKLTKEEMFDFILRNNVSITAGGGRWTRMESGEQYENKYRVTINDSSMCGMDLEEAIQFYVDNYPERVL